MATRSKPAVQTGEQGRARARNGIADCIHVRGARVHNLKNIEVKIPRNKLVVFTGPSGSGKSSLAFDTIYAEGQRRYLESLSSYARQFLQSFDKPEVDHISGLSPAIAIEQKAQSHNPRSTVGTVTEVYDYLRVLYARAGRQHCTNCGKLVGRQSVDEMVERILELPEGSRIYLLAPVAVGRKGEYKDVFNAARMSGFARVRVNGEILNLSEEISLDKKRKQTVEIVVDRLVLENGGTNTPVAAASSRRGSGKTAAEMPPPQDAGSIVARLSEAIELALKESGGTVLVLNANDGSEMLFSERNACVDCGISYGELTPQLFSFNSPQGACPACDGLGTALEVDPELIMPDTAETVNGGGVKLWGFLSATRPDFANFIEAMLKHFGASMDMPLAEFPKKALDALLFGAKFPWKNRNREYEGLSNQIGRLYKSTQSEGARGWYAQFFSSKPCPVCGGRRLKPEALAVQLGDSAIDAVVARDIEQSVAWFKELPKQLSATENEIAAELLKEIRERLGFLLNVGLGYLTLSRQAPSLSGGESQRIRLASQIGSGLTGVLYVLDEPSIGLHQRDNRKLIATLENLRDLGNTVLVVEHDEETMRRADMILDFGPHAGLYGGQIVAQGTAEQLAKSKKTITGRFLAGVEEIAVPATRRQGRGVIEIVGAEANNLKQVNAKIPIGCLVCVSGVSGSGKSSLVNEVLWKATANLVNGNIRSTGRFKEIRGIRENVDKVIQISQRPIGRTPRSNPATYTGLWDPIRKLFAELPESRVRGFQPGRFSFNVKGGRCEACQGDGVKRIEMHFLSDVFVQCDVCHGRRFNRETLAVAFKGKNIYEVLEMSVAEALTHFANIPVVFRGLQLLADVGLDYIKLGQSAPTLSGGESQRVKLARELSKRATGRTLYLLDEPTTGLHFEDIRKLLAVLSRLVEGGNTVLVIEHNLDVIKTADWVIDLGPEGGAKGGYIIAEGPPELIAATKASSTGEYLKPLLGRQAARGAAAKPARKKAAAA